MPGNSFGKFFKVTTWGESHGKALGAVIDGCPANILLTENDVQKEIDKRKPKSFISTKRKEEDKVEILSGVFENKTTGTPISMIVWNRDAKSKDYDKLKDVYRPGHADFSYEKKFGIRDYRGGGRSSGRETISRVMAGAVAKKILGRKIKIIGHTIKIGDIETEKFSEKEIENNEIRCADKKAAEKMIKYLKNIKKDGDSAGGIIELQVKNMPKGLGETVFDKLDADIAKAMMSIGGVKGVEIGSGFDAAEKKGSENNDEFIVKNGKIITKTNNSGGVLGGISFGGNLVIKIAVKAPASISKKQKTINRQNKEVDINIYGRHDACIVPRLIPVAKSMLAITLADHLLRQKAIS
jgi:chorismate synthase